MIICGTILSSFSLPYVLSEKVHEAMWNERRCWYFIYFYFGIIIFMHLVPILSINANIIVGLSLTGIAITEHLLSIRYKIT